MRPIEIPALGPEQLAALEQLYRTTREPGSPVRVRAVPADSANGVGRVRIEVVDHGWGVRPEDRERIFEKFRRARDGAEKADGAGLGLYLSRRIVRAHGSELTVEPKSGEGSVFAFELEEADHR